jgi:iron(III) transport system substrate-binding protein
VEQADYPKSINDLIDPKWNQRVGVAKPLFGTTATHAACLFATLGEERAKDFFVQLKKNARIYSGNKQVARAVSAGQVVFGLTDTDDAVIEIENGYPVAIVYPDQDKEAAGTLFIPNTLAIIAGGPNRRHAERLIDFLLSPDVEKRLAEGRSAQIPLNRNTKANVRVETPDTIQAMAVDFPAAAQMWDKTSKYLAAQFVSD